MRWIIFGYLLTSLPLYNLLAEAPRLPIPDFFKVCENGIFIYSGLPGNKGTATCLSPGASITEFPADTLTTLSGTADFFILAEDSLKRLALDIVVPAEDSARLAENDHFRDYLFDVLREPGSLLHPFDSLKTVSMLMSPDSIFRIITWYVPLAGQQFRYFGFVQIANASHEKREIYVLQEEVGYGGDASGRPYSHDHWYGSLYYELIANESAGKKQYVLLGWRGDNPYTRKRIIEPFSLDAGGAVFGSRVFRIEGQDPYRVIFEYSSRVTMGLLFDWQYLHQGSNERLPMIVFDRLAPIDESFHGDRQHYVPEGNIFDAFLFSDDRWEMHLDVDARRHPEDEFK